MPLVKNLFLKIRGETCNSLFVCTCFATNYVYIIYIRREYRSCVTRTRAILKGSLSIEKKRERKERKGKGRKEKQKFRCCSRRVLGYSRG